MESASNLKVLILSMSDTIFHKELAEQLSKKSVYVKRVIFGSNAKSFAKLFNFVKCVKNVSSLSNEFDILNVHYVDPYVRIVLPILTKLGIPKYKKIILTIYGSDYYKINERQKRQLKRVIEISDKVTFINESTLKDFDEFFGGKYSDKLTIVRFGSVNMEKIRELSEKADKKVLRKEFGIPTDKIVITCGYNALEDQQHEKIIFELSKLPDDTKKKIFLVFPMTYGANREKRVDTVQKLTLENKFDYFILQNYADAETIAKLRIISDIMINLRKTDQLSASMLEHLFAGNYVITGTWLPYDSLISRGVELIRISDFEELSGKIEQIILEIESGNINYEKIKHNKEIAWELNSWERNIDMWVKLYSGCF